MKIFNKSLVFLVLTGALFFACKKQNDKTQWDVEVLGPVLYASLTLNDLMADTTLETNSDGSINLIIEQSFYDLNPDSIYNIPDTTITNITVWPIFTSPIQPSQSFYSGNNKIALGIPNVQLTKAIMRGGVIELEIKNTLPTKVYYTYIIPKALKNGTPFTVTQSVDAANSNGPGMYSGSYSLAGYKLDLTGVNGNEFNTISYTINAIADPAGTVFTILTNDTIINLKSRMIDLDPEYVKGYLGQNSLSETDNISTGLANFIMDGYIQLDSVTMDIEIKNSIGADAQVYFNSLMAINSRTSSLVYLTASSFMQRPLNINRAQESGPALSPVIPSVKSFHLDNSNSNIKGFIENLPERIAYDVDFQMNPLGNNFSFYTDFLYSDFLVEGKLKVKMPFRFAAQNLSLVDTQDISLGGLTNLDPIGPLTLTLLANNGFPVDFDMQLFIVDENRIVTDSLLIPGNILRADVDALYKVISPKLTKIEIPVDEKRKEHILNSKYMGIRTIFNTPDYPQQIQLYSSYRLDLKLIANGTYYIR